MAITGSRPASGPMSIMGRLSSLNQRTKQQAPIIRKTEKITLVQETTAALKRQSAAQLGSGISHGFENMSFSKFVSHIKSERLATLPHQGSKWDTVLIRSLFVAENIHKFQANIEQYAAATDSATALAFSHLQLLLQLGHHNADALDKVYGFFYKCSLTIKALLERSALSKQTPELQYDLCALFADLLSLVVEVTGHCYRVVHGSTEHAHLDIYEAFGDSIDAFHTLRTKIVSSLWRSQLSTRHDLHDHVEAIEKWLAPQDRVLDLLATDHTFFTDQQTEQTGVWIQDDLAEFIKSDKQSLLVTAEEGCGKTNLATAVAERLQRPLARQSFNTVFVTVGAVPVQCKSIDVVKTILSQLFKDYIGDMNLYSTLLRAYNAARETAAADAYEGHLWTALSDALKRLSGSNAVIIVDGLDEIEGGKAVAQKLLDRLVMTVGTQNTRLIAFARDLSLSNGASGMTRRFTAEDTRHDVWAVIAEALAGSRFFKAKDEDEQEHDIASLVEAAKGSFLWASLACELLKLDKSAEAYNVTLKQLTGKHIVITDMVSKLTTALQLTNDAKMVLSFLSSAARPLTFEELSCLFSINVEKGSFSNEHHHIHHIVHSVKPLVALNHDVALIRHPTLVTTLKALFASGHIPLPVKDRKGDFLLRILTYAKLSLATGDAPLIDVSDCTLPAKLFPRRPLLEYAVRYWQWSYKKTSFYESYKTPTAKARPELQQAMPSSVDMAILEWILWDDQFPGAEEVDLHDQTGRLRALMFGEKHATVVQSHIAAASFYIVIGNDREACKHYYQALTLAHALLKHSHTLVIELAVRFLDITATMTSTKRCEIMTQREKALLILIEAYEHTHGQTAEIVIRTRELLIELYIYIGESEHAEECIHKWRFHLDGHKDSGSTRVKELSDHLRIRLRKGEGGGEIDDVDGGVLISDDEEEEDFALVLDLEALLIIWRRADAFFEKKCYFEAEELYVEIWQHLALRCRTSLSFEWHEHLLRLVNVYAKFLRTLKRETEAVAILVTIWEEYRHHALSQTLIVIKLLTEIAHSLKTLKHFSIALLIYRHISAYFHSTYSEHHHHEHKEFMSLIEEEIISTSTEVVKHTSTTETTTISSSRSIFESIIKSSKTIEQSTLTLSKKLTVQYIERQEYDEAISVISQTLFRTWSSFLSETSVSVSVSSSFFLESVWLVEQLVHICVLQGRIERAAEYHCRLFRAIMSCGEKHKELMEKTKSVLIAFFDKHCYYDRSIHILQEVLVYYTRVYGHKHELTIAVLYELGQRCKHHALGHPYWLDYYQQIITTFCFGCKELDARCFDAALIIAFAHWEERRYTEAITVFSLIWHSFVHKSKHHKEFSSEIFVQQLFERYYQCLIKTQTCSFESLYEICQQYRKVCISVFSATAEITIKATLTLARLVETSVAHLHECISLYEEVTKHTKSTTVTTEITTITKKLTKLYRREITESTTTCTTETLTRAVTLCHQELVELIKIHGYHHESTMTCLKEVVSLYFRLKKVDVAMKEISAAIIHLINTETVYEEQLMTCAISIAHMFQFSQQIEVARKMIEELHIQIISRHRSVHCHHEFDLTGARFSAIVFLATLEFHLHLSQGVTFAEVYAELLAEHLAYKKFREVFKPASGLDKIIMAAAPLRFFLFRRKRTYQAEHVEKQIIDLFVQRDCKELALESRTSSPKLFIIGLLDYLGGKKHPNFVRAVVKATNVSLKKLVDGGKFAEAYDVANMGFMYAQHHKGYHRNIAAGFGLAAYLDGRGENRCPNEALRKKLLQLCNRIVREILNICEVEKINIASLRLSELNELIALLGEQQDYALLESILSKLWTTRDAHTRAWPADVQLKLGRRLVCARYLAAHHTKAVQLCLDIAYNLRRAHGVYAKETLSAYRLLAELYTSIGQAKAMSNPNDKACHALAADYFKKAIFVHEDVLSWLVRDNGGEGTRHLGHHHHEDADEDADGEEDITPSHSHHGESADRHDGTKHIVSADRGVEAKNTMRLLKLAYERLGNWPKSYAHYEGLNAEAFRVFAKALAGVDGVEKWSSKGFGGGKCESQSNEGAFDGKKLSWEILESGIVVPKTREGGQKPVIHSMGPNGCT